MTKRNVLYLIADDWSPLAGCYGSPVIKTPATDRFATESVTFEHAFCTSPSCAVSRANIMTGQYSHTHGQYGHCHGIHGFRTHENMPTLPAILGKAGWHTALIGKSHIAPMSIYPFADIPTVRHLDGGEMAAALRATIAQAGDRPFYAHLGFADPHRDFAKANRQDWDGDPKVVYDRDSMPIPNFLPDHPAVRDDLAEYYQAISRLDANIGMALQVLEETGHRDDTLVIITSDHGMPFTGAKGSPFEGGHHVPLLIRAPGRHSANQRNRALVNHTDHLPTILDWCGVPAPEACPGRSVLSIIDDSDPSGWDETYFSHNFHEVTNYQPYRVLRERRYKYVRNLAWQLPRPIPSDLFASPSWEAVRSENIQQLSQRPRSVTEHAAAEELYDLEADPAEAVNLAERPEHAERLASMRERLTAFRFATRDPWLQLDYQEGLLEEPPKFG